LKTGAVQAEVAGYRDFNLTSHQPANFLMAVNKRFLWKNTGGSSWALVTGYAAGALAGHTQIHVEMVQGTDKMFFSDVFSNIQMWDGVTTFTDLGSGGATQPPFGCVSLAWHTNRLVAAASSTSPTVVAFSDILDGTTWDTATSRLNQVAETASQLQGYSLG
jgi:hypothetical protein